MRRAAWAFGVWGLKLERLNTSRGPRQPEALLLAVEGARVGPETGVATITMVSPDSRGLMFLRRYRIYEPRRVTP